MYNVEGIINMVGAVIRCAVADYQSDYLKKTRVAIWEDAKDFLFSNNRLEDFFKKYELNNLINCAYVRSQAMNKIYSQYYVPRSKVDLLKSILPHWKGSKTELRQYSIQRLRDEFHRMRQEVINNLMKKD